MADVIVVYDADKEIAAYVDPDTHSAFGPAHIGPQAATALEAFMESTPYDIRGVDNATLVEWFDQFAAVNFPPNATPPVEGGAVDTQPSGDSGMADAARAEHEAVAAGAEPPPPQPADTDMEADAGAATAVTEGVQPTPLHDAEPADPGPQKSVDCPACNATGSVPSSEPGVSVTCNLCKGTTKIQVPA